MRTTTRRIAVGAALLIFCTTLGLVAPPASQASTSTFTGNVDASGTSFRSYSFSVPVAGTITATLQWANAAAKLNFFLRDPSVTQVAADSSTNNPKTITYNATTTGTWSVAVKAQTGASNFTITVDVAGTTSSAPQYQATIGGSGHAEMYPSGLDVDPVNGFAYIADTGNDQIKAYDTNGDRLWQAGNRGLTPKAAGNFGNPRDVAYMAGKLYVADTVNNRIQVAALGTNRSVAPTSWTVWAYKFTSIIGITGGVDGAGNPVIFAADEAKNQVLVFDPTSPAAPVLTLGDGTAASGTNQLNAPRDAASDSAGNIYVADYANNRIVKFDPTGTQLTTWGSKGSDPGFLNHPYGIAIDAQDQVYVADGDNGRIQKFAPTSSGASPAPSRIWGGPGTASDQLLGLRRVAVGGGATPLVYAADLWGFKLLRFPQANYNYPAGAASTEPDLSYPNPSGTYNFTPVAGKFNEPYGVAVDDNQTFVMNTDSQRVEGFNNTLATPSFAFDATHSWGDRGWGGEGNPGFNWARDVAIDKVDNNVWVADTKNDRLLKFDRAGTQLANLGGGSLGPPVGRLNWPHAVASYPVVVGSTQRGDLIVADTLNNTVERWNPSQPCVIFTNVLKNDCSASVVWRATAANGVNFLHPKDVSVVGNTVYVADTDNKRVVTLNGADGTYAGKSLTTFTVGSTADALHAIEGVAVDPSGNVWISDSPYNRLLEFDANGNFLQKFGSQGTSGHGVFNKPSHLEVQTANGRALLFVVDTWNDRVEVFDVGAAAAAVNQPPTANADTASTAKNTAVTVDVLANDADPDGPAPMSVGTVTDGTNGTVAKVAGGVKYTPANNYTGSDTFTYTACDGAAVCSAPQNVTVSVTSNTFGYKTTYGFSGPAGMYPYGMAWDKTDNTMLVADFWNYRVKRYDVNGVPCGNAGALCAAGSKFIVSRIAPRSTATCTAGPPTCGGIGSPFGVAADANGNFWVGDQSNSRLVQFDHNGKWLQTIGSGGGPNAYENYPVGCGNGKMTIPTHVVVDPGNGRIYETDPQCRKASAFSPDGHWLFDFAFNTAQIGVNQVIPRGIDMDNNGNIYIVDFQSRKIVTFDRTGAQKGVSAAYTQMNDPRGLVVDRTNNLIYVTAAFYNEVYKFSIGAGTPPAINFVTVWNSPSGQQLTNDRTPNAADYKPSCGSAGATVPDCRFDSVRWSTVDQNGNIYVGDTWGYRVWKFKSDLTPASPPLTLPSGPCTYPYTGACQNAGNPQPPPDGGYNQNNGIAVSTAGAGPNGTTVLYVIDTFENRGQMFDTAKTCVSNGNCPAFLGAFGSRRSVTPQSDGFEYPVGAGFGGGFLWAGGTNAVLSFSPSGTFVPPRYGSHGTGAGQFSNGPRGIAAFTDPAGGSILYTTDSNKCRLQKLHTTNTAPYLAPMSPTFGVTGCGNTSIDELKSPQQVAATTDQSKVVVADFYNSRVAVFSGSTGHVITSIKGPFDGMNLAQPTGVAIDPSGTWLYISDTKNNRIVRTKLDGTSPQVVSVGADLPDGQFNGPGYLAFGPDGVLYVSDNSRHVYAFYTGA
ncbi:MAG: tripartite motif-containing protein 71 [Actinomycetota bacterium]